MKRVFLHTIFFLSTMAAWAEEPQSAVVYPDCELDTIHAAFPATVDTMAHWMSYFQDTVPLFDLIIPGTHESSTYYYSGSFTEGYIKDQVLDYKDTWNLGARAFDLRLAFEGCYSYDVWDVDYTDLSRFHHGDNEYAALVDVGPMNEFPDDVNNHFPSLEQLEKECMILIAKKEYMAPIYKPVGGQDVPYASNPLRVFEVLMRSLVSKYGTERFIAYHEGMTLGEARGKILLFVRDEEFTAAYDTITGTPQVTINYITAFRSDWNIDQCIKTPVDVKVYKNGQLTDTYHHTYTQDIYNLGKCDTCKTGILHKIAAIYCLAEKKPTHGESLCCNLWNCYCMGTFLPDLWAATGVINDSIATLLSQNKLNARGIHLLDFYGVDSYSGENFYGLKAARELVRHNFRIRPAGVKLKLNADGCENANEYTYGTIANTSITALPYQGKYFSQWTDGNMENPRSIEVKRDMTFTAKYNYNVLYQDESKNGIVYNFTGRDCSTDDCSDAKTITLAVDSSTTTNIIRYLDDSVTTTIDFIIDNNIGVHYTGWEDDNADNPRVITAYGDTTYRALTEENIVGLYQFDYEHHGYDVHDFTGRSYPYDTKRLTVYIGEEYSQYAAVDYLDSVQVTLVPYPARGCHFGYWSDTTLTTPNRTSIFSTDSTIHALMPRNDVHTSRVCRDNDTIYDFTRPNCAAPEACETHILTLNTSYCDKHTYVHYTDSDNIYLYADETEDYHFLKWSDGVTDNPREVAVGSDTVFTAEYSYNAPIYPVCEQDTLTIDYIGRDGASSKGDTARTITLRCEGCDDAQHVTVKVHNDDVIYLNPLTDATHHFIAWSDSILSNPRLAEIDRDTTFTAVFAENNITLYQDESKNTPVYDFTGNRGHRVNGDYVLLQVGGSDRQDSIFFRDSTVVTITAVPNEGYTFAGWSDGCYDNPRIATMKEYNIYKPLFTNNPAYIYQDNRLNGRTYQFKSMPSDEHPNVDLGLPSGNIWARMNIGAKDLLDYGELYSWGEIEPKDTFCRENYRWMDENGRLLKYCSDTAWGTVDSLTMLEKEDDVAQQVWKNEWRIPTKADLEELVNFCSWTNYLNRDKGLCYWTGKSPNGDSIVLTTGPWPTQMRVEYIGNYASCENTGVERAEDFCAIYIKELNSLKVSTHVRYWLSAIRPVRYATPIARGTLYAEGCETTNTIVAEPNSQISITAVPMEGYHFRQWSDGVTDNPRQITITDSMNLTAQFASDNVVYWDCSKNGHRYEYYDSARDTAVLSLYADSCELPNVYVLNRGDLVRISAMPTNGTRFVQWSDGVTDIAREIDLNGDTAFYAQFELQSPDIFVSSVDSLNGKTYDYYTRQQEGHEYVDLGLSNRLLWAATNLGATSPEQIGNRYAWGEVNPKGSYEWLNYQWAYGSEDQLTKYYEGDGKTELYDEDDAAHVNWGGGWRMPTTDEMWNLITECTTTRDTLNDVGGYRLTGPNQNSIFIPGDRYDAIAWTKQIDTDSEGPYYPYGVCLVPLTYDSFIVSGWDRANGIPVRAVCRTDGPYHTIVLNNSNGKNSNTFLIDEDIPEVIIRASEEKGWHFVQWSDSVTDNPRSLPITNNRMELTAVFAKNDTLVLAADSAMKIVGAPDTILTWHIARGELLPGDSLVGVTVYRNEGETPGIYPIHVEAPDSTNPHYWLHFEDGNMRIFDGEHRLPLQATDSTLGYEREHWYNKENRLYYTDGYMSEVIVDSLPLHTYPVDKLICRDLNQFELYRQSLVGGHEFSFIAKTTYETSMDLGARSVAFSVRQADVENARLLWYKDCEDPRYGQFHITVSLNDTVIYRLDQGQYDSIGGFYSVPLPNLRLDDVVQFCTNRISWAQWEGSVSFAAILQYTHHGKTIYLQGILDEGRGTYFTTYYDSQKTYAVDTPAVAYTGQMEGEDLMLTAIPDGIIANDEGVILRSDSSIIRLNQTDVVATRDLQNMLTGTDKIIAAPENAFTLAYIPNEMLLARKEDFILGHTAYLLYDDEPLGFIRLKFQDPTEVQSTRADSTVRKVLRGGRIYILRDNRTYNAQGQHCRF